MKIPCILIGLFLLVFYSANCQSSPKIFAQGLFTIESKAALETLQSEIRSMPTMEVVRLDYPTQRFFILTKDDTPLSEEAIQNLFGPYSSTVRCIQTGVRGNVAVKPYPFVDCQ